MNVKAPQGGALENSAGVRVLVHSSADRFAPLRISDRAESTIQGWIDRLARDEISLAALPSSLHRLYQLGVSDGRAQREDDVRRAELEADRLWLAAFTERDRREYLLGRLDRAAEIMSNVARIDTALDEAWSLYVTSLANVRQEVAA